MEFKEKSIRNSKKGKKREGEEASMEKKTHKTEWFFVHVFEKGILLGVKVTFMNGLDWTLV